MTTKHNVWCAVCRAPRCIIEQTTESLAADGTLIPPFTIGLKCPHCGSLDTVASVPPQISSQ